ncbi:DNA recombination protein RmuC [bacterium NHP-B]|nr:DNA recombination protein RmuC [bacterium NHP-B]
MILLSLSLCFCLIFWAKATQKARSLAREVTSLHTQILVYEEQKKAHLNVKELVDHHIKHVCSQSLENASQHLMKQSESFFRTFSQSTDGKLTGHAQNLQHMIQPLEKSLEAIRHQVQTLEKARVGAYEGLHEKIHNLSEVHAHLHHQTTQLAQALKTPNIRGKWGEMQLRRLVEWAGMLPFCDFFDQKSFHVDDKTLRPDLVIRMPEARCVVVDAKAPLAACLPEASDTGLSADSMRDHVQKIKHHIYTLSRRDYTTYIQKTPDFILLFLPTESLLIKALEADASLLDYSAEKSVLLATPMTLIALLKVIAMGWQQEVLSENAQEISDCGKRLSQMLEKTLAKLHDVGKSLGSSVKGYNAFLASLEDDVMPEAQALSTLTTSKPAKTHMRTIKSLPKERKGA